MSQEQYGSPSPAATKTNEFGLLAERESLWNKPDDNFDTFADEPVFLKFFTPLLRALAYLGFPSTR